MPLSKELEARLKASKVSEMSSMMKPPAWMNRPSPTSVPKTKKVKALRRPENDTIELDSSPSGRSPGKDTTAGKDVGEPASKPPIIPQVNTDAIGENPDASPHATPERQGRRTPSPVHHDSVIPAPKFILLASEGSGGSRPPNVPPASTEKYHPGKGKTHFPHFGTVFDGRLGPSRHLPETSETPHTDSEFGDEEMSPYPEQVEDFLGDPQDHEAMKRRTAELFQKQSRMLLDLSFQARKDREAAEERHAALMDECARLRDTMPRNTDDVATSPEAHVARIKDYAFLIDREARATADYYNSRIPPRSGPRGGGRWKWLPH